MLWILFLCAGFIPLYGVYYLLKRYNQMVVYYEEELRKANEIHKPIPIDPLYDPYYELKIHTWGN